MKTAAEIRDDFLRYFAKKHEHTIWPSSKIVLADDPTLLFVNAGMNQFKAKFTGTIDPTTSMGQLKRAVDSQKCIRAGGKHNDLDDVGKDCYHHTFFEMLGSWSFGDYFKAEAISMAWDLLTNVWKLSPDRLYVTYFGGEKTMESVPPDTVSKTLWAKYLPESRILPFGAKDNFWEMGDVGPCGPCSEIHFDRIGGRDASSLVNADDPNVLEIWNLVFMEYNRQADQSLSLLPFPCVDTGMGFERIVSVLQDKTSNYDTDVFSGIMESIHKLLPESKPYHELLEADEAAVAYRVIADHVRTLSVAIADGVIPSNEGAGYVLRRVLRRAVRYGYQYLNASKSEPWLCHLVQAVAKTIGNFFTEIRDNADMISSVIEGEERLFSTTISKGIIVFTKAVQKLSSLARENALKKTDTSNPELVIPGNLAFEMYATYGFPLDLIEVMAREKGFKVDIEGYNEALKQHRKVSLNLSFKWEQTDALVDLSPDVLENMQTVRNISPTDDAHKYNWVPSESKGIAMQARILALWQRSELKDEIGGEDQSEHEAAIVLDKTTFYAESGGQVADKGFLASGEEKIFAVSSVRKLGKYVFHIGKVIDPKNVLKVGDAVTCLVDYEERLRTARNHTATHALGFVLRAVTGVIRDNKGTDVRPNRGRYDYSAYTSLTDEEILRLEELVGKMIQNQMAIDMKAVNIDEAAEIPGKCAQFGEQYPQYVRVVSIGAPVEDLLKGKADGYDHSVEYCGGTHLHNTADMKDFLITNEESVAKGVRRLLFVTGADAQVARRNSEQLQQRIESLRARYEDGDWLKAEAELNGLKAELDNRNYLLSYVKRKQLRETINQLIRDKVTKEKKKQKPKKDEVRLFATRLMEDIKTEKYLVKSIPSSENANPDLVTNALAFLKSKLSLPTLVILEQSNINHVCCVTPESTNEVDAKEWAESAAGQAAWGSKTFAKVDSTTDNATIVSNAHKYIKLKLGY